MVERTIVEETHGAVRTITLNRPDRLNAFTREMAHDLLGALDRADGDDAVRAVIVAGAGRAFCAGSDLSAGAATFDYESAGDGAGPLAAERAAPGAAFAYRDLGGLVALRLYRMLKPVIGAINGAAVGVGVTMTLPMDMRLASETAKFGFVFTRRGIVPEAASSFFLPRLVGVAQAAEWCMTGRVFDAEEALRGGLVRSVHAPDALMGAAFALAREIADNAAPVSVALTRQMLWRSFAQRHPMEAHHIDSRAVHARGRQNDAAEGVSSFLEKRPARFRDRVSADMPGFYPWFEEPEFR